MLECVINISEGRDLDVVTAIARAAGDHLLDTHTDPDHNRTVLTVVGEEAPRAITAAAVTSLDLARHVGVHPRMGVVDVVPFVPLGSSTLADAEGARDRFAAWASDELELPCFLYGRHRSLPEIRREAFGALVPDLGPSVPHPTAGAVAVGARPALVAYNLWLERADIDVAQRVARELRGPTVRAIGLEVGRAVQVSMNLIDPLLTGPADVYDQVASEASIARAELVGLVPRAVVERIDVDRWASLDLAADRTIESRLATRGLTLD